MKNILTILFVLLSLISTAQNGNEYFRIGDVRDSWYTQSASFDTIVFEVKPKGLVTEIGVYMDISTRGTNYKSGDSLEIQMSFTLPDKADVTDMWLWVGKLPVKADIYDKWTASQIYENIVRRRTDPSILYKYEYNYYYWDNHYVDGSIDMYMLRVFPLMTNQPRKVKFTYLIPTEELNTSNPFVELPAEILRLTKLDIKKLKVRFFSDNIMKDPFIPGYPSIEFHNVTDPKKGNYAEADLTGIVDYENNLSISFSNSAQNNQYTGTFANPKGEDYYMMNIMPGKIFNIDKPKKGLFLFDFVKENCSSMDATQMLSTLKAKLHSNFTSKDSFNIMLSGMITRSLSDEWLPADSLTIENTINSLKKSDFNSYSSLPSLLIDGINFIKNNHDGSIILIASSNSNGAYQQANDLIKDYLGIMGSDKIPIHILDLDNIDNYNEYHYIGNTTYYGNEYLYVNLSMQTIGEYYSLKQLSFNAMLSSIFQKLSGYFTSFDLYVTLENGYTYASYDLSENLGMVYFDQPIQKVGKYTGSGNFKAIISAQLSSGEYYHNEIIINQNDIVAMDSIVKTVWAAHMLRVMKTYEQTNTIIGQIISMSMTERVLTDYTAFLALEPGIGKLPIDGQEDDGSINLEEVNANSLCTSLSINPNPVYSSTELSYTIAESGSVKIIIYDLFGKIVKIIDEGNQSKGNHKIKLDTSEFAAGTYVCKLTSDKNTVKIVKMAVIR